MNTDIQIDPDQQKNGERENSHRREQDNALLLLVLRTLICILVIDLSIWGYFKFIKGVSFADGVKGWQTSVQEFLTFQDKQDLPKQIVRLKSVAYPLKQADVASSPEPAVIKYYLYKIDLVNGGKLEGIKLTDKGASYQIFSKEGLVTEIDKNKIKKIDEIELLAPPRLETKYTYHGGTILLPITVSHNGHQEQIKLILDTGCSITQIHPDVLKRLNVEIKDRGKSTIADGRTIDNFYGIVDSLQVGPLRELNFPIGTNYIEDKHGIDGLLGMNFLRRHPFDIDRTRQVVIWK